MKRDFSQSTPESKIVWQCDAYGLTIEGAIRNFCDSFWDKPRKFKLTSEIGIFKLRDGSARYYCRLVDNIPPIYRITRLDGI